MSEKEITIPASFPPVPLVYFVKAPNAEAIKIGKSSNLNLRFSSLQLANPEPLQIEGVIVCASDIEALLLEHTLHQQFADLRIRGEWYRSDPMLGAYIIDNCTPIDAVPTIEKPQTELVPLETTEGLSKRTGISAIKIRRLANAGILPALRIGTQWRFETTETIAALARLRPKQKRLPTHFRKQTLRRIIDAA